MVYKLKLNLCSKIELKLLSRLKGQMGKYFCGVSFSGAIMSAIYEEKKDDDGFLYVTYSGENTFGDD